MTWLWFSALCVFLVPVVLGVPGAWRDHNALTKKKAKENEWARLARAFRRLGYQTQVSSGQILTLSSAISSTFNNSFGAVRWLPLGRRRTITMSRRDGTPFTITLGRTR